MNSGYARDYRRWTIINFWPVGNHWRWWCAGVLCNTRRISYERKWAEVKVVLWCTVYPSVFLYSHRNEKAQQQQNKKHEQPSPVSPTGMFLPLQWWNRECSETNQKWKWASVTSRLSSVVFSSALVLIPRFFFRHNASDEAWCVSVGY